MLRFLRSPSFWIPFVIALAVLSLFFLWELGMLHFALPMLPRIPTTPLDLTFTGILWIMLSFTTGLAVWRNRETSCPVGVKRATGIAGALGALSLLCPICIALPVTLLGFSLTLSFLAPFVPLLRIIAIVVLATAISLLWPKKA